MSHLILLKENPKVEFQLKATGFNLINTATNPNSFFYLYEDLKFIELQKPWYPRLAKWLRVVTWLVNGVPFFPDAETCKKAKLLIRLKDKTLAFWLTDTNMVEQAKLLKQNLNKYMEKC